MSDNKELIKVATELKKDFLQAADDLDIHVKNVNIARISGSSVAIVGGATAIGAGIAAFFTFGITIPLAIAAAVVATTGGVTAGGASVAGLVISKERMNRMDNRWKKFQELYRAELDEMQRSQETLGQHVSTAAGVGRLVVDVVKACKGASARAGAGAAAGGAARAAVTPARLVTAFASPMVVVNVVLLGFSIYDLVDASLEIHSEKKSPAGDTLRKLAEELDAIIQGKCTACGRGKC